MVMRVFLSAAGALSLNVCCSHPWLAVMQDTSKSIRVLDVVQGELDVLGEFLDAAPHMVGLELAATAGRWGTLELERWLNDRLQNGGSACFSGSGCWGPCQVVSRISIRKVMEELGPHQYVSTSVLTSSS